MMQIAFIRYVLKCMLSEAKNSLEAPSTKVSKFVKKIVFKNKFSHFLEFVRLDVFLIRKKKYYRKPIIGSVLCSYARK